MSKVADASNALSVLNIEGLAGSNTNSGRELARWCVDEETTMGMGPAGRDSLDRRVPTSRTAYTQESINSYKAEAERRIRKDHPSLPKVSFINYWENQIGRASCRERV